MDVNKDLLQKIQLFLEEEEEIFGPLAFSPHHSESDSDPNPVSDSNSVSNPTSVSNPDRDRPPEDASGPRKADDKTAGIAAELSREEVINAHPVEIPSPDEITGPEEISSPIEIPKPENISHPDQCTTLDELRDYCDALPDLKTDLQDTNLVFGVGNPNADLMIIGEAPGEKEDRKGEPFVGAAGQLLNKILGAIHFKRKDVYIANILKHRPPGNRNPSDEEIQGSLPILLRQIDLVNPKVILCVGKVPAATLLEKDMTLSNMRGQFYPFRNAQLTVTYHPAALLRNPKWKRPVWEDVQKVRQKYDELGGKP